MINENAMDASRPLTTLEKKALNRVGLNPENLPQRLDDYICLYLKEKAEVLVRPSSSTELLGSTAVVFTAGIASGLSGGGTHGVAGPAAALTAGNIKKQTSVQEWMHWKQYALDKPDFQEYKSEWTVKYENMLQAMKKYIRSEKGKICCDYERLRIPTGLVIGFISVCGNVITLSAALIAQIVLTKTKGVSLVEWTIQKVLKKPSFASIRPRGGVNENGELVLEY